MSTFCHDRFQEDIEFVQRDHTVRRLAGGEPGYSTFSRIDRVYAGAPPTAGRGDVGACSTMRWTTRGSPMSSATSSPPTPGPAIQRCVSWQSLAHPIAPTLGFVLRRRPETPPARNILRMCACGLSG